MRWSTFRLVDLTSSHIERWRELHKQETALRSPFTTYEFCRSVDRVRGQVFVSVLEHRGKSQAFFAFERSSRYFPGIARKPGGHLSDCYGIIGGSRQPLREQELLRAAGLSVFSFDHVPVQEQGMPVWRGIISHGLRVELADFDSYIQQLRNKNKKFVKDVERLGHQLVQQYGPVDFRWQTTNQSFELERLIDRKRSQYLNSGNQDALQPAWTRRLLSELLDAQETDCQAILSTLYCGETWIASNLALVSGDLLHIWFPVYNRQVRRFGPGHILFFNILKSAADRGLRSVDFGGGVASYKKKYDGYEYPLLKGSIRRPDLLSIGHAVAQSMSWRLRPLFSKYFH